MVSDLVINRNFVNAELARRQKGYGRGARMEIEKDKAEILSGVKVTKTLGGPITVLIKNKDTSIDKLPIIRNPRPGHADLAGALKYNTYDMREILERSSARETAARVAVGALCKSLLREFKVEIISHTRRIGRTCADTEELSFYAVQERSLRSKLSCADEKAEKAMRQEIDKAKEEGDSVGGIFEVIAINVPPGLGSHVSYDRKLDGRLARSLMSVQAVKGVEVGLGFGYRNKRGSQVHDEIQFLRSRRFHRATNNAGGIEGGISNGEPIVVRGVMKPISTLKKPLSSVDVRTKKTIEATVERADVCAVPAAGVVGEACVAFELANAFLEKFGGDSLPELRRNLEGYLKQIKKY
jgi:chorismate synthase